MTIVPEENNIERQARKSSIVFKDISKEDLKFVREREMTPVHERSSNKFHIAIESEENNLSLQKLSKFSSNRPSIVGKYIISTNDNSTIKLHPNCKFK